MMKTLLALMLVLGSAQFANAEESVSEKATAAGHDVKHAAKKGVNRVKEAVCAEGDAKCMAKKAGHHVDEAADKVSNKAKETKDKVDSDATPTK